MSSAKLRKRERNAKEKTIFLFISECKGLALALCTFRSKKFGEAKVTKKIGNHQLKLENILTEAAKDI